jgi:hypothetical protein
MPTIQCYGFNARVMRYEALDCSKSRTLKTERLLKTGGARYYFHVGDRSLRYLSSAAIRIPFGSTRRKYEQSPGHREDQEHRLKAQPRDRCNGTTLKKGPEEPCCYVPLTRADALLPSSPARCCGERQVCWADAAWTRKAEGTATLGAVTHKEQVSAYSGHVWCLVAYLASLVVRDVFENPSLER